MKKHGLGVFGAGGMLLMTMVAAGAQGTPAGASGEYAKHFEALRKLSIEVAEAMPAKEYGFRPHPESMDFGALMAHIATTNYQFCAGLKDADTPALPTPTEKGAVVKFLTDSFAYCGEVIPKLTEEQLTKAHNSPDGNLPGREILLAMYVHVAHHRGQAEIYLRDKGIRPPSYRI
ncbi:MAG TPA: DinB family protein [Candidatus Acidoferrum sp.]|nr:DinB family protein [Candidatus Acidoferrum sp.]